MKIEETDISPKRQIFSTPSDHYLIQEISGLKCRILTNYNLEAESFSENLIPTIILHGWGGSIEAVMPIYQNLRSKFPLLVLDLPGHGQSVAPREPWGVAEFSEWLKSLLLQNHLKKINLICHSHGGRMSMYFAKFYPELIDKLILVDASGIKPKRKLNYYFKVSLAKTGKFFAKYFGRFGEKIKQAIYNKIASADYKNSGELRRTFVKLVNQDISAEISQIRAKTLIIWGEDDQDTPIYLANKINQMIPGSQLAVIKNAGHFPYLDQPQKFNMLVNKFLES